MVTKNPQKIAAQQLDSLRNKLLRELESEARDLLKQLSQEFSDDLQTQSDNALQGFLGALTGSSDGGSGALGNFGGLLNSAAALLFNRPKVSTSSEETARSQDANAQFRLSQGQTLAEASVTLSKGNKNL